MTRQKHNALIIDTETTMKNEKPFLAYNIGGTLGDIYSPDSVPLEFDFYVEEIISNPKNFEHTYIDKETGSENSGNTILVMSGFCRTLSKIARRLNHFDTY